MGEEEYYGKGKHTYKNNGVGKKGIKKQKEKWGGNLGKVKRGKGLEYWGKGERN